MLVSVTLAWSAQHCQWAHRTDMTKRNINARTSDVCPEMPTDEVILFNGHPAALTKHHKASELSRLN